MLMQIRFSPPGGNCRTRTSCKPNTLPFTTQTGYLRLNVFQLLIWVSEKFLNDTSACHAAEAMVLDSPTIVGMSLSLSVSSVLVESGVTFNTWIVLTRPSGLSGLSSYGPSYADTHTHTSTLSSNKKKITYRVSKSKVIYIAVQTIKIAAEPLLQYSPCSLDPWCCHIQARTHESPRKAPNYTAWWT